MTLDRIIKNELELSYHIEFEVKKIENEDNSYNISLVGSDNCFFKMILQIKNKTRLIITCEPEKYGAKFLQEINNSDISNRHIFCDFWKQIGYSKVTLKINGNDIVVNDFINDKSKWSSFVLRLSYTHNVDDDELLHDKEISRYSSIMCGMMLSLFSYTIEGYNEGNKIISTQTKYERNPINRQLCLFAKGYKCSICGFEFKKEYGNIGENFIEVHHSIPVSIMESNHVVDPIKELFPVCPNCHAMLHKRNPPFSIDELIIIRKAAQGNESN